MTISACLTASAGAESQAVYAQKPSQPKANASYKAAIPTYQAALKTNPNDAVIHNQLGICFQQTYRLAEAVKEYKQSIKLAGSYAEPWNNLGSVYHGKRNLKQAVKYYRKAIQLKPDMATAHKNLGSALLEMGKVEEGAASYRRAFELDNSIFESTPGVSFSTPSTNLAMMHYYYAKLCAANGRTDAAFLFLKKACALGFHNFAKVERDPDFKLIVSDAKYADLKR
jgi:tetratricopeptide (TPR) repeat protein